MADTTCPFHDSSIQCYDKTQCHRCGWNPHVDAIRKEEIRRKLADAPHPPVYEKPTMIIKWR